MIYAVIHDNRLINLHSKRDEAKAAALKAATQGVKYAEHSFLYEPGGGERCEVLHRPARNRRWIKTGYFVDAANPPE